MKTFNIILIILFANTVQLLAQNGILKGHVLDSKGKPAPYVSIQLQNSKKGTISNENGDFEIQHLAPQHYTLIASYVGYKTLIQKIKIESDKTLNLALELFENSETLKEIIVKGYISQNDRITNLGKLDVRPMDLPQSIMTIDHQILDNQQAKSLSDILMNTNGVYIMGTTGGYQEEIAGRGYAYGSSNTFKNGVRYYNGMMLETSGLEKVEVIKGSSAVLYGNVAAGGILNLVTKKPKHEFGGETFYRFGSFGLKKVGFDVYGPLNKHSFRLNGSYEKANSFRVGVSSERLFINPSVLFKINKNTDLLIEADYLKDNRTPDFGAGIINYQIVDIPRSQFVGIPWSNFKANQASITGTFTHYFNNTWKLNAVTAFRKFNTELFSNTRPNAGSSVSTEGNWIRNVQRSEANDHYFLAQADLTGIFKTQNIEHHFLTGFDAESMMTSTLAFNNYMNYDTINVFNKQTFKLRTDIPLLTKNTLTDAPINRFGIYVQDLINLTPKLKVLAGLRYTFQNTQSNVLAYANDKLTKSENKDGAFSPRLGIVYQPDLKHSFFASYSNSFALNTGVDTSGKALPPSIFNQYEIGIKNELFNGKASLNITGYIIDNSNLAQTSLVNGNTYTYIKELAGSVRSQGVEVDAMARPLLGLRLIAGYSYNKTYYVNSNTYIDGSLLRYNPNHTANFSAYYQIKNLMIGLNGVYIGQRFAGRSTRIQMQNDNYKIIPLPAFTQFDANLGYQFKHISFRAKAANIFNVLSYNVHDDNSVNPIAPRNYTLTAIWKF